MKSKPKHLLVIRLSAMGDVAMTAPVLRQFSNRYPEVKITVLTRAFFTPIFKDIQGAEVFPVDVKGKHKGILGLFKLSLELKALKVDAVADLHNVLRSNILKFFMGWRRPFFQIDKGRTEKKALTRAEAKVFRPLKSSHQRYVDVFEKLGFQLELSAQHSRLRLEVSKRIQLELDESKKHQIGIAPFAQYEGKTYPIIMMEKVIKLLSQTSDCQLLLFGGGEKELAFFNEMADAHANVVNMAGKLAFEDELSVISNLDLMLSMDSGNGHLAAIYGVPTITIWGVTHPYAGFAPFKQPESHSIFPDLKKYDHIPTSIYGNKVPSGYEKVMYSISPETIVNKVKQVLEAH